MGFGQSVGGKQAALGVTHMGTLDVALCLLDGHLSVSHWVSQGLSVLIHLRGRMVRKFKSNARHDNSLSPIASHLVSLNDKTQKMSKEHSVSFLLQLCALNTPLLSGAERTRWLLRAGPSLYLWWV